MRSKCSRLLALLMAVMMIFSLMPVSALAASDDPAITLEADKYTLYYDNGNFAYKETKAISSLSEWQYLFHIEERQPSGTYRYGLYVLEGNTRHYICDAYNYSVRFGSSNANVMAFSVVKDSLVGYAVRAYTDQAGLNPNNDLVVNFSRNKVMLSGAVNAGESSTKVRGYVMRFTANFDVRFDPNDEYSNNVKAAQQASGNWPTDGNTYEFGDKVRTVWKKGDTIDTRSSGGAGRVYQFSGWHDASGLGITDPVTMPNESTTFSGTWKSVAKISYEWSVQGKSSVPDEFGSAPDSAYLTNGQYHYVSRKPADVTYNGVVYTFDGWYNDGEAAGHRIQSDGVTHVTFTGTWVPTSNPNPDPDPGATYTVHVITAAPSETDPSYTASKGSRDIKVRYENEDGDLITFNNQKTSFPITLGDDGKIEVSFDNFVAPAGSNTSSYNGGDGSTAKLVKAFFYYDGHGAGLSSYTGRFIDIDWFRAADEVTGYNSYFSYHISRAYGGKNPGELTGKTLDYDPTGVVHLVFTLPVTVSFDANDSAAARATGMPEAQSVYKYESAAEPTTEPERTGYRFLGWYTKPTGGTEFDFDSLITGETTLYAHWEESSVKVTFNTQQGTHAIDGIAYPTDDGEYYTKTVTKGSTVTAPDVNPLRSSYRFLGWYEYNADEPFDFSTPINSDLTLYARYVKQIRVTYDHGDGSVTVGGTTYSGNTYFSEVVDEGAYYVPAGMTVTPSAEYDAFSAWFKGDDQFFDGTVLSKDTTLVARYAQSNFIITFHPGKGSEGELATLTVGGTEYDDDNPYELTQRINKLIPVPDPEPVLEGYDFLGWYTKDKESGEYSEEPFDFTAAPEGYDPTDLYGLWEKRHTITFVPTMNGSMTVGTAVYPGTGGEYYTVTVSDGEDYTIPNENSIPAVTVTAPEGYRFLGWARDTGNSELKPVGAQLSNVTDDVTLCTTYERIEFTVTYDAKGGQYTANAVTYPGDSGEKYSETVYYGDASGANIEDVERLGYSFDGWFYTSGGLELEFIPKQTQVYSDLDVYAKWTENTATLSYDTYTESPAGADGGYVSPASETIGVVTGVPAGSQAAANANYEFRGWYVGSTKVSDSENLTKDVIDLYAKDDNGLYENTTFTAHFTERTATLSYNACTETPADADGGYVSPASETIGVISGVPAGSQAIARPFYKFVGWYAGDTKISDSAVLTKDVIDLYAKDDNGLYTDTTFTAHFTERVYTIDITKTVSRSSSSEKPGRASFTFELGALNGAAEDTALLYSTEIHTNGTGKYTGSITVYGHVLADQGMQSSYILTENDDGLRYWRYDASVYHVSFDPDSDTVGIALEGRNGSITAVSAAAFENRYSRVENDVDFGRVEVIKIDEDDEETYLEGAKFKLYETDTDRLVSAFETDRDGKDTSTVAEGSYYLVESASPEGYTRDTDPIKVTVKADKTTTVYVTNKRTDTPKSLNDIDHYAYIVGYPDGTVRPQGSITRAEVATIFFRLLTDDVRREYLTDNNSYSDVNPSDWYCTAVSTLSKMGIINGYTDGTFNPGGYITRAEFAAIAARFELNGNTTEADFSDIYTHWAKKEISIAANNGWILGYEDGSFRPNQLITRAEAMTLVNRVLNRVPEDRSDLLRGMTEWTDNMNTAAWYYLAVQEATNSHEFERKNNGYETWTELRANRDWTEFER